MYFDHIPPLLSSLDPFSLLSFIFPSGLLYYKSFFLFHLNRSMDTLSLMTSLKKIFLSLGSANKHLKILRNVGPHDSFSLP